MTEVCAVVITASDAEWLAGFVRQLVSERLCAGAHVTPIRSIYRWQGAIHDTSEAHVTLHTQTARVEDIIEQAEREHPYEVPCVIATPITGGSAAYIDWIIEQTSPA